MHNQNDVSSNTYNNITTFVFNTFHLIQCPNKKKVPNSSLKGKIYQTLNIEINYSRLMNKFMYLP